MLWVLLGSQVFCFSENLLKVNIFPDFLVQYKTGIRFFCLLPSLPSHLGNSAELIEFNQFIPSSTDSKHTDVSGVGIDSVRTEAVTTRPSLIGLGRFFEPWLQHHLSRKSEETKNGGMGWNGTHILMQNLFFNPCLYKEKVLE